MTTLTWLHISDLHWRKSQAYEANVVAQELLVDIANRADIAPELSKIDFIFVTGDIAFSGRQEEYILARRFFDELRRKAGVRKSRLLPVPGNHDVYRSSVGTTYTSQFFERIDSSADINALLGDDVQRAVIMKRFEHYQEFVNDYYRYLRFDNIQYFYCKIRKVAGQRIAIIGLNSAWSSSSNVDRLNLFLGERQVRAVLDTAKRADIRIALMHHPFEWLRDFDRDMCKPLLLQRIDFLLHGHFHRTDITRPESPGSRAMVLGAGASYEHREYPNAYNFVHLDFTSGKGIVYLRTYSNRDGGFWTKDMTRYKNAPGYYEFFLPERLVEEQSSSQVTPDRTEKSKQDSGDVGMTQISSLSKLEKIPSQEILGLRESPSEKMVMSGLSSDLYRQCRNALLGCSEFDTDKKLRAVFVNARLEMWRNALPQVTSIEDRVDAVIDFLYDKYNAAGENGLVVLLYVLRDRTHPQDSHYKELTELAEQLAEIKAKAVSKHPLGDTQSALPGALVGTGIAGWWRKRGYSANPFEFYNAAYVPDDQFPALFESWHVEPSAPYEQRSGGITPTFDEIQSLNICELVMIYSPPGSGKTFYCRGSVYQINQFPNYPTPDIVRHASHISNLPARVKRRTLITACDLAYCVYEHIREELATTPKSLTKAELPRIFEMCDTVIDQYELGRVYVFIDLDQLFDDRPSRYEQNAQAIQAIADLCRALAAREMKSLSLRIFVPSQFQTLLQSKIGRRSRLRIKEYTISWKPWNCRRILEKRLEFYAKNIPGTGVEHLARLFTPEALDQFDKWLESQKALSPRCVIRVFNRLARYAFECGIKSQLIDSEVWDKFLRDAKQEIEGYCSKIVYPLE